MTLKRLVKKLLTPVLGRIGFVPRSQPANSPSLLENLFTTLVSMGFQPKHIVDVGANHGSWTRIALRFFPDAYFTLLEPQISLKASIQDILDSNPRVHLHNAGAGETAGSFKFTIASRDDSCSFNYSSEQAAKLGFRQIDVPVVTLEGLLKDSKLPHPDMIKIDAEGLDLMVVKGAGPLLAFAEVIFLEAAVMNKNFQNNFTLVVQTMQELGYTVFDFTDLNRTQKHRALWLTEIAFVKRGGKLDAAISDYATT